MKLYNELPPIEIMSGSTLDEFQITVEGLSEEEAGSSSMWLIVADAKTPTEAIIKEQCTFVSAGVYSVQLGATKTAGLKGSYIMHFALMDTSGNIYRRLKGVLKVHPVPDGGAA